MILCFCSCSGNESLNTITKIEPLAKYLFNKPFFTARIEKDSIVLIDSMNVISKSLLPENSKNRITTKKIRIITKTKNCLFFTMGGAVDDEFGLVYSPTEIIDFEGIKVVKRISGGWFYFSTKDYWL